MSSPKQILRVVLIALVPLAAFSQAAVTPYHTHDELTKSLQQLEARHKDVVHLESIGRTREGRDIWAIGLRKGDPEQHRALLLIAGVEPSNLAGTEMALLVAEYFAASYGQVQTITRLLNTATVYIIPQASPDAAQSFFAKPRREKRTNGRPTDDDRDGATDEDDCDDVNGDGLITLMRVKDPQGEWMVHPDDPRVMKPAVPAKNERGQYKLYQEGIDNDKDERWNEDPAGGVDFNKNFAFQYEFFPEGSGPYRISEAETRAVSDFVFSPPSILASATAATPYVNEADQSASSPSRAHRPPGGRDSLAAFGAVRGAVVGHRDGLADPEVRELVADGQRHVCLRDVPHEPLAVADTVADTDLHRPRALITTIITR